MIVVLNLRAFENLKSHSGKHADDFVFHQSQRMQPAHRPLFPGKRDIHGFLPVPGLDLQLRQLFVHGLVALFRLHLELVDHLAHGRALFLRY